ncbi:carboxylating nicotinate-nucleotide diphosphorylase [Campylobacter sp. MG1]|uniref:carboxylating nicotinate-nucleotide diphosphorylase n=1 Tax=Campylobacter sp. MG1 TaxID=2976332 RepID=UPI00226CB363|nr:carboxylating nicotinate-nucleotide diphosphorylase [Campylobacter sp. MG1]
MLIDSEIKLIQKELNDDLGRGDLFSQLGEFNDINASLKAKSDGVFAGEPYFKEICKIQNINCELFIKDGEKFKKGDILAKLKGKKNIILLTERTLLNFVQHASGIATKVNKMKELIKDYNVALLDTRKTRPGLRVFEKYAIRCGGGQNHRLGLDDCIMIKDTHLAGVDNIVDFIKTLKTKIPYYTPIEIECDTLEQVKEAFKTDVNAVLLDNMSPKECADIVNLKNKLGLKIKLEASGNITEDTIVEYAKSGVDVISSGANIYKATWVDFSLRLSE